MRTISLWQPWASAIFANVKQHETRSWKIPEAYLGEPVAIHAAKKDTYEEQYFWKRLVLDAPYKTCGALFADIGIQAYKDLPRGAVIGIVKFTWCRLADSCHCQAFPDFRWGDYGTGRHIWRLEVLEAFRKPVPCVGKQGFFDWDREGKAA